MSAIRTHCRLLIPLILVLPLAAADKWQGEFRVSLPDGEWRAGQSQVADVSAVKVHKDGREEVIHGVMDDRGITVELVPYRFNQFADAAIPVPVERAAPTVMRLQVPQDLATGWYLLTATAHDDDGHPVSVAKAGTDGNYAQYLQTKIVVVRGDDVGPYVRLHTERARSVFSPGEHIRLGVSARPPRRTP